MPPPPPTKDEQGLFGPGAYFVVSTKNDESNNVELRAACPRFGSPNNLYEYVKAHPEEYDVQFIAFFDRVMHDIQVARKYNFEQNLAQFRYKPNEPYHIVAVFGPFNMLGQLAGNEMAAFKQTLESIPNSWTQLAVIFH